MLNLGGHELATVLYWTSHYIKWKGVVMGKKITPEDILDSGSRQIIRPEQIYTMLTDAGFEQAAQTGTSHTHYTHPRFGITVGGHNKPKSALYQKEAAKAVLTVREMEERQRIESSKAFEAIFKRVAEQSEAPGAKPVEDVLSPEDGLSIDNLEAYEGICVIRDTTYPQIGLLFNAVVSEGQKGDIRLQIETQKGEFVDTLRNMQEQSDYELSHSDDGQTIHLRHRVYGEDVSIDLPAYDPLSEEDPVAKLTEAAKKIEDIDTQLQLYVQELTEQVDQSIYPLRQKENGNIVWDIPVEHFLTGETRTISLETTQNHRASPDEMFRFTKEYLGFQRDYGTIKNYFLDHSLGISCSLSKGSRTKPREITASLVSRESPFFKIVSGFVPPEKDSGESTLQKAVNVSEILDKWERDRVHIQRSLSDLRAEYEQSRPKLQRLFAKISQGGKKGVDILAETSVAELKKGGVARIRITDEDASFPAVQIRYVATRDCKGRDDAPRMLFESHIIPEDVEKLERAVIRAGLMVAPEVDANIEPQKPEADM